MEERLCLEPEMMEALAMLKGKVLKAYEADFGGPDDDMADCAVILHTGSLRAMISRFEMPTTLFGEPADAAPLRCFVFGLEDSYSYTGKKRAKLYLVNEKITGISVVRDSSKWFESGESKTLVEDEGVILRTPRHLIAIICIQSEGFRVRVVDSSSGEDPMPGLDYFWHTEDDSNTFSREIIEL